MTIQLLWIAAATILSLTSAQADLLSRLAYEKTRGSDRSYALGSESTRAIMRERTVLLIGGFLNESGPDIGRANGYFADTMDSLKNEFGAAQVRRIRPSSLNDVESNAEQLLRVWQSEHQRWGLPLVIIAHSKGCVETLLSVMRHPEILQSGMIDRMIFIQGAFYGSPIADVLSSALSSASSSAVMRSSKILGLFPWLGLESMRRSVRTPRMQRELAEFRDSKDLETQKMLSDKIYYVPTYRGPAASKPFRLSRKIGELIWRKVGLPNDGVLATPEQAIAGLGTTIGILDADHVDLVGSEYTAKTSIQFKRAVTRAVIEEVYQRH